MRHSWKNYGFSFHCTSCVAFSHPCPATSIITDRAAYDGGEYRNSIPVSYVYIIIDVCTSMHTRGCCEQRKVTSDIARYRNIRLTLQPEVESFVVINSKECFYCHHRLARRLGSKKANWLYSTSLVPNPSSCYQPSQTRSLNCLDLI